jgi:hypothetical protein
MPSTGLPTRFRARRARLVLYPLAAILVVGFIAAAAFVPGGEHGYGVGDRAALALLGVLIAAFLVHLSRLRIEADEDGVTVVNVVRRRRLAWGEIIAVRQPPGEAWLVLDLSDGTALHAMGIQASDGAYAREEALRLARLVAGKTRTP